ncbi:MAG TPA: glutaredoxin family protein [Gammaproteobacteria bacterium]|nr:glutaredoxin family protein [Gammaproteobacteria bacterium]
MTGRPERVVLTLYYREGCHLCQDMLQALRGLQSYPQLDIRPVDIDRDPVLRRRWDEWVPVLCSAAGEEICHHFLDPQALARHLAGRPPAG